MLNISSQPGSGEESKGGQKTWTDMIIDSAIIGGIAVFASIGSMPLSWDTSWIAFKAFGAAFLVQLAIERGLKRARPEE